MSGRRVSGRRLSGPLLALFVGLALLARPAEAATSTRLQITAPAAASMGEDIVIEVRLTTADGRPVAGATLVLFQVGAVGQREMARQRTDAGGLASFLHSEFTLAHLALRVAFAGDGRYAPSQAATGVEIADITAPPAVVMSHTPGALIKGVVFSVLGAVWLTYLFAISTILHIRRGGRPKGGATAVLGR